MTPSLRFLLLAVALLGAALFIGSRLIRRFDEAVYEAKQETPYRDFGFKKFDVNSVTSTSANVVWQTVGAKRVGVDLFHHNPEMTEGYPDWEVLEGGEGVMVFYNLKPDTIYDFEIVAYASDGPDKDEQQNKTMVHGKFKTSPAVEAKGGE